VNPCEQIGKNLWNNFVSPATMRRSIYDDSLELLCPDDANAPLPLTPPATGIGAASDGDGDVDGTDVLRVTVTEKSNDWIQIQFKNQDGQQCTTEELNKSGSMANAVHGHKIVTYKGSVLKPLDKQCQQTLSAADTLYFRVVTKKQRGKLNYDKLCVDQVQINMSAMKLNWSGHLCIEGESGWQEMAVIPATCG
jgi:hypothetical protein